MQQTAESKTEDDFLIPWYVISVTAISRNNPILIASLGPRFLGIRYRTSESGIWQTEAFDITDLIVLAPLLLIGGVIRSWRGTVRSFFWCLRQSL